MGIYVFSSKMSTIYCICVPFSHNIGYGSNLNRRETLMGPFYSVKPNKSCFVDNYQHVINKVYLPDFINHNPFLWITI